MDRRIQWTFEPERFGFVSFNSWLFPVAPMEYRLHLILVLGIGMFMSTVSQNNSDLDTAVFIVTLREPAAVHFYNELRGEKDSCTHSAPSGEDGFSKSCENSSRTHKELRSHATSFHDSLLNDVLKGESYVKLYSYHYLINGFALLASSLQAEKLARMKEVRNVVMDFSVRTATTHTPKFLGLQSPAGAWVQEGGYQSAGERIVIGFVDTGIYPAHPSFSDDVPNAPYPVPLKFSGVCEVTVDFPSGSCNRKVIGARHFAKSAITRGVFNASEDHASPFDSDGHGTHTASVAAGNHGIPVTVAGLYFGNASGMAPHAHIAVYKALYKGFGGFAADVVAAIDQAAEDGVDIINLSIASTRRPPGVATFFNPIDMALLEAARAGIFVVQAVGNTGPAPKSISSFSPWIFSVGAASHDRVYHNLLLLGNNETISGAGLASGTCKGKMYTLVSAIHALNNETTIDDDIYVGECQNLKSLNHSIIQGNLLICSYSIRFALGLSTIKKALQSAKNLEAAGVVFYMDPFVTGFEINPIPMEIPAVIIPSPDDSKVFLRYYNSSLVRDEKNNRVIKFAGVASISGGANANYSNSAPKVMFYSARGPDPEDNLLDNADIMKPNVIAPGNSIWGAWSSLSTDSVEFEGENFAMMSGTSMAAPHVAGIAALIKQKFPFFSASAIASALSTTATIYDNTGAPIMAQRMYANPDQNQTPATFFDMGSGFVNATAALNPGLIFESSYNDYVSFLCGIDGSAPIVLNYTSQNCRTSDMRGANLNLPSITVAKLNQSMTVNRTVTNVAGNETYGIRLFAPIGVSVKVAPASFFITKGEKLVFTVFLNATINSTDFSFGSIGLYGDGGHFASIPLLILTKICSCRNDTG